MAVRRVHILTFVPSPAASTAATRRAELQRTDQQVRLLLEQPWAGPLLEHVQRLMLAKPRLAHAIVGTVDSMARRLVTATTEQGGA